MLPPGTRTPASEDELVSLVREAAAARRPLVSVGRGTKRHHGPGPTPGAALVSLRALSRITSHEPGDLVVSVQAGVRIADLQRTLAAHGQWLPLDPPYADATVGGVLATASAGPRRLGYGAAKDLLLGLRVVGAQGVVTRSGGRVVKNVTGYDLHKLHVGAFGSLGVLLEAHFKVRPRPEVSGAVVLGCADLAAAHRLLLEIWGSALRPVALEALAPAAAAAVRGLAPGLPPGEALAVVGVEDSRPVFDRHVRELEALRGRASGLAALTGPAAERLWLAFRDLPDRRRTDVGVRLGARPHDLPGLLDELGLAAGPDRALVVHAGLGVARLWLAPGEEVARAVAGWHERAAARGGYAVVESAPPELPGRADLPWGGARHDIGRALKQAFDPDQILNPGRMAL